MDKYVCVCVRALSHVQLFATLWTVAYQALLSMGFSRQEHQTGMPSPSPGDFPNPRIESASPALAGGLFTAESLLLLLLSRFSRVRLCATP